MYKGSNSPATKIFALALLMLFGLSVPVVAQQKLAATSITGAPEEPWRKSAPNLPPPRDLQMPKPQEYSLPNGLTVSLLEDHRVPFVTVLLGIKAGSAFDSRDKLGLSSLAAEMLTEGTSKRTSKQIAAEVDLIGGSVNAASDADFIMMTGSTLSKYQDRLFDVIEDVLLNPSFPEDELSLQKTNILQGLAVKRGQPGFLLDERFNKVVFGEHPYSVVAPTPESIKAINRDDLINFHKKYYLPNVSSLVIVGDFDTAKMKALIEKSFGSWDKGVLPALEVSAPPTQKGKQIYLVDRPGSVQSSIKLGNLGISKNSPDYFPAIMANQILGGSSFSRLFLNIREQKGYTYGAYSGFVPRKQPGLWAATAEVRTAVTGPSLKEFLYEIDRIRNGPVSKQELDAARNYLNGSFQLGLESQAGIANRLIEQKMYELPADYLQLYTTKVAAVTPEDVQRIARKYMNIDDLVIAVVADAAKVKSELAPFAPIQVYDAEGKLITDLGAKQPTSAAGKSKTAEGN